MAEAQVASTETEAPEAEVTQEESENVEESDWFKALPPEAQKELKRARSDAGKFRTKAREYEQKFERWGGADAVERLVNATQSEEGIMQLYLEAGHKLGLPYEKLQGMFQQGVTEATEEAEEDDEPLTKKALEAKLREILEREVKQPLRQQNAEQAYRTARAAAHDTLDKLGVTDQADRNLVLKLGQDFAPPEGSPEEFDPRVIAAAVRKGHEEFQKLQERYGEAYVKRKSKAREAPTGLSGGSPATFQLPKEPENVKEATRLIREARRDE